MILSPSTEYDTSLSHLDFPRLRPLAPPAPQGVATPLFASFTATMAASDFSKPYIIGSELHLRSFAASHDSEAV